jgi:predicted Zn-dependent peptidase
MEKNVILEEIGMYQDRPHWRLQDTIVETHFGGHPLSYRVLGTVETIQSLSVGQMCEHFERCYGPDSIIVAVAGHIAFDRLVSEVERCTGHWQSTAHRRQLDEPHYEPKEQTLTDPKLTRHYIAMMCPGPSAQDEWRYAAGVLADVLGDADGSRLYWALVDPGLADEADFSHDAHDCAGSYVAFASCDPDRAQHVEQIMLKTIEHFVDAIDPAEIERAKNKIATAFTLAGENPAGRMRGLGQQWTYLGRYLPLELELERIMAVEVDHVRQLIDAMPFSPRTIVRLGPGPK